jgi:hypothetical protein
MSVLEHNARTLPRRAGPNKEDIAEYHNDNTASRGLLKG